MQKQDLRAPKDALEKRAGFYLYKNLEIQATQFLDGGRRQEIYLNDGRIANAAKLNGNISDENMRKMLIKTADFKNLVFSIGVSISSNNSGDVFNFKMIHYGKTDPYNSGTKISADISANGVEQIILLNQVEWSADDDVIGQFAITFPPNQDFAKISVRLYLQNGFTVPAEEPDEVLDANSPTYSKMIENSLVNLGNTARFKKAVAKAQAGEDVTIAYIGGSITQGAGAVPINTECYAYQSYLGFVKLFAKNPDKMHFVKAGAGGTCSELGCVRYENDVTQNGAILPDVVIVEYAVNDEGDETKGECYEGLVRHIWNSPSKPAVILLFSVFADNYTLQDRFIPFGNLCSLPMVSLKNAVCDQFEKTAATGRVISRQLYYYDIFHPSNAGHRVMADCLINYFKNAAASECAEDLPDLPVYKTDEFEKVQMFDRRNAEKFVEDLQTGDFTHTDTDLQCVERNLDRKRSPMFPDNWQFNSSCKNAKPFSFKINCALLLLVMKDSASAASAKANVFVDGKLVRTLDPREIGWTHCNALVIIREKQAASHNVQIVPVGEGEKNEFTILGFGKV